MNDEWNIDREAIRSVYCEQNLGAMREAVERGDWTLVEAAHAHEAFMTSNVLLTLIEINVQMLRAFLNGQVH